jgi:hypothetical protein
MLPWSWDPLRKILMQFQAEEKLRANCAFSKPAIS